MHIVFDMDGVLADFEGGFVRAWTQRFPEHPPVPKGERRHVSLLEDYPLQQPMVQAVYHAPGFFRDLEPMPGALDAVRDILSLDHDVRICSSPLNRYINCVPEKYEWVERHLGTEFVPRLILAKDKTWVHGDYLIDDKPEVIGSRTPSWQHVVFDQPYNRHVAGLRMNWSNWRDVLGL